MKKSYITWNMKEQDGNLWFSFMNINGLCKVSLNKNKAEFIGYFEKEDFDQQLLYADIDIKEDNIILAPFNGKEIAIFDMKSNIIKYIPFENYENENLNNQYAKYSNLFTWKNNIFILGYSFPMIIKIDMQTNEVEYIYDFKFEIEQQIAENESRGFFTEGYFIKNEKAYLPIGCLGAVLELDLNSNCSKIIKLKCNLDGIGALVLDQNEMVWLVGRGKKNNILVKWDINNNSFSEWKIPNIDKSCWDPFHTISCLEDKVILWPSSAQKIIFFDLSKNEMKELNVVEVYSKNEFSHFSWTTLAPVEVLDKIIFISGRNGKWFELDKKDLSISEFNIDWNSIDFYYYEKKMERILETGEIVSEKTMPIQYFFRFI